MLPRLLACRRGVVSVEAAIIFPALIMLVMGAMEFGLLIFGWEDRPPGLGWTDQDYDDIVFVMKCPTGRLVTYGASRLVR